MNHRKIVGMAVLLLIAVGAPLAWAAETPPVPSPIPVSFGVSFDTVLDGLMATKMGSYGCAAPYSCNEPCDPQRVNCVNNCGGNPDCVFDCYYCHRVCVFTC